MPRPQLPDQPLLPSRPTQVAPAHRRHIAHHPLVRCSGFSRFLTHRLLHRPGGGLGRPPEKPVQPILPSRQPLGRRLPLPFHHLHEPPGRDHAHRPAPFPARVQIPGDDPPNASRRAGGHSSWASASAQPGNQTRLSSLSWFIFDCSRKKQTQFVFNRPGRKLKSPLATHTPSIWSRRKNRENFVDATAPNCQTNSVKPVEQSFVHFVPILLLRRWTRQNLKKGAI